MGSGYGFEVLASTLIDGAALDLLSDVQNALSASEVDVCRREVVEALVVAAMIVVVDEVGDGAFEIARQVVVLEQESTFQSEMPAFDLALGHGVIGLAAGVRHALVVEPFGQFAGDIGRAVVAEQARPLIKV